jgi:P4 family phage/plasmid primase-like protien
MNKKEIYQEISFFYSGARSNLKKWTGFKNDLKNKLTLGTLMKWLKEDDIDKFSEIQEKIKNETSLRSLIVTNKKKYPKVDITDIDIYHADNNAMYGSLKDNYCPFIKKRDENHHLYFEITLAGLVLKCGHRDCFMKMMPQPSIQQNIFNVQIINNNYNGNNDGNDNSDSLTYLNIDLNTNFFDDKELNILIIRSLSGTQYDIALVLHYLYNKEFNCTWDKKWYKFDKICWKPSNMMKNYMSSKLVKEYEKVVMKMKTMHMSYDFIKRTAKIITDLKNTVFKNNLLAEAAEIFYNSNSDFLLNLDKNKYLLGFTNGVYDLKNNIFRKTQPDDYISIVLNYDYEQNPKYIDEVNAVIEKILSNKNIRLYGLKAMATCLSGEMIQKIFILNGNGSNGKSLLIALFMAALGQYCSKMDVGYITQKRQNAESASAQLTSSVKKRALILSEPNTDDKLNTGILKEWTGGEPIVTRGMYEKEAVQFIPMFKMFLMCNSLPKVDEKTYGIWRRIRCINFPSKFLDDPDENNPDEHKIDYTLESKRSYK